MLRSLIHYRRIHAAVALAGAVATAVLTGALLVGDSVRGSLRDLTLNRLGKIDLTVGSPHFFREGLADDLTAADSIAAPLVSVRGSATLPRSGARATALSVVGVDERFLGMFEDGAGMDLSRPAGRFFPGVVLSEALAEDLGASAGDDVVLAFERSSDVPRATLLGETEPDAILVTMRASVTAIVADRGIGGFGVAPTQQRRLNAFVALAELQRVLEMRGRVNTLALAAPDTTAEELAERLATNLLLEDYGLGIERREDHLVLSSREYVLRPPLDRAVREALDAIGAPYLATQSYLANTLRVGPRETPYSLVAAVEPPGREPWSELIGVDGAPAAVREPDGILLNEWAAEDLGVIGGETLSMAYYRVGADEQLAETRAEFRVEGVVAMRNLGADPGLTPEYPGIQQADDMAEWDPPFPVDLGRVRTRDEDYWDEHRAAPKAFVAAETARRLWGTRFGSTTAVRIGFGEGDADAVRQAVEAAIVARLDPAGYGYRVRAVKREGLRAAAGATDFSGLFIGFSLFIIVSAALLVGLLFRLGTEQRAGEVGLLLSVGHTVASVRNRLLGESAVLAVAGTLVGLPAGIAYAALLMKGLSTWWKPAVGSSELTLHIGGQSLLIGALSSSAVVGFATWLAVRRLVRMPATRLLAGRTHPGRTRRASRGPRLLAVACLTVGAGLVAFAVVTRRADSPGLAFGSALLLLVGGLASFAWWSRREGSRGLSPSGSSLLAMAARNGSWNPGRSMLCVGLVASASFLIFAVAASREQPGHGLASRESGSGGFELVAESEVALYQDLGSAEGRLELGFSEEDSSAFDGTEVFAFRLRPGDDASCLNLYRPEQPRLLGAPEAFVRRGGFRFAGAQETEQDVDPWSLLELELEPGVVPAIADANSAQWILHLGLGDELTIEDELGEPMRLRLVGLLHRSLFQGELLIAESRFLEHFPSRTGFGFFLLDSPDERVGAVRLAAESALGRYGFDVTTTRERLAAFRAVENTYLSTFLVLGGLGLLLGTLGLGIVLVRNVLERRGELATLRAFGFRQARLAWLVLAENTFLLLAGMAIGTGAALAAVAPRLAVIDAPWGSLAATFAVVFGVGLASSLAGVISAMRVPLLGALKDES